MKRFQAVGVLAALALIPAARAGVVINVDINASSASTYSGPGAYNDGNRYWNGLNGSTSDALTDSDGVTHTPVTVSLFGFTNTFDVSNLQGAPFAGRLFNDYAYNGSNRAAGFRIDHLTPSGTYDLYLYAQQGGFGGYGADFTIDGQTKTATGGVAGNPQSDVDSSFEEGDNYVQFEGVRADDTGSIFGSWDLPTYANPPGDVVGTFNGLQIVEAPEPGSAAVVGVLGGAGLLKRRRRPR